MGNGQLTISNIGFSGEDGVLVVSNIGSSGLDGVRLEISNIGSSGQDCVNIEVDLGPAGGLTPSSQFIVNSFFDIAYRIEGTDDGRGSLSVLPSVCRFDSLTIDAMLDDVVTDTVTLQFVDQLLQTGGQLVVSNIESSGLDGVRFITPPPHKPFVFYDIILLIADQDTTILDHAPVTANRLRMTVNNVDTTCSADNSSVNLRASGMNQFGVLGEPKCGDADHVAPIADINLDCKVNLVDLSLLGNWWLTTISL